MEGISPPLRWSSALTFASIPPADRIQWSLGKGSFLMESCGRWTGVIEWKYKYIFRKGGIQNDIVLWQNNMRAISSAAPFHAHPELSWRSLAPRPHSAGVENRASTLLRRWPRLYSDHLWPRLLPVPERWHCGTISTAVEEKTGRPFTSQNPGAGRMPAAYVTTWPRRRVPPHSVRDSRRSGRQCQKPPFQAAEETCFGASTMYSRCTGWGGRPLWPAHLGPA